jgi:hypothetical protein
MIVQASITTPPGDEASWFYSFDCASACNHPIAAGEVGVAFGRVPSTPDRGTPFTLGIGLNGFFPYAEGYVQLSRSAAAPYGVGARVSVFGNWRQQQIYARVNKPLRPDVTMLWNPGVLVHQGRSPNGENPGSILALVNGLGLELGSGSTALTPSIAVVLSHSQHDNWNGQSTPETRLFATAAIGLAFRRDPRR